MNEPTPIESAIVEAITGVPLDEFARAILVRLVEAGWVVEKWDVVDARLREAIGPTYRLTRAEADAILAALDAFWFEFGAWPITAEPIDLDEVQKNLRAFLQPTVHGAVTFASTSDVGEVTLDRPDLPPSAAEAEALRSKLAQEDPSTIWRRVFPEPESARRESDPYPPLKDVEKPVPWGWRLLDRFLDRALMVRRRVDSAVLDYERTVRQRENELAAQERRLENREETLAAIEERLQGIPEALRAAQEVLSLASRAMRPGSSPEVREVLLEVGEKARRVW